MSEPDAPKLPTPTNAGTGNGTYTGPEPGQETIDAPVLDGASESDSAQAGTVNPRRGMTDPGLVRNTDTGEKTPTPDETA